MCTKRRQNARLTRRLARDRRWIDRSAAEWECQTPSAADCGEPTLFTASDGTPAPESPRLRRRREAFARFLYGAAVEKRLPAPLICRLLRRLQHDTALCWIAEDAPAQSVRLAAAAALTDDRLRTRLCLEAGDDAVRRAAAERIHDRSLLTKAALTSDWPDERIRAVAVLTDRDALAAVAAHDADAEVRAAAGQRLTALTK